MGTLILIILGLIFFRVFFSSAEGMGCLFAGIIFIGTIIGLAYNSDAVGPILGWTIIILAVIFGAGLVGNGKKRDEARAEELRQLYAYRRRIGYEGLFGWRSKGDPRRR